MKNSNHLKIAAKHRDKVLIFNGLNGLAVEKLKSINETTIEKKMQFYDKWNGLIYFSNNTSNSEDIWTRRELNQVLAFTGAILTLVGAILAKETALITILIGLGVSLAYVGGSGTGVKDGHRKGFLDGYEEGFHDGIDSALCLDETDKKMIAEELEEDKALQRELRLSKFLANIDKSDQ